MGKRLFSILAVLAATYALGSGVAQAAPYSLNLVGKTGTQVNIDGAIFQASGSNSGSGGYTQVYALTSGGNISGYNYDGPKASRPFDQTSQGVADTHLELGSVPVVIINGVPYLQFLYDAPNFGTNYQFTDIKIYVQSDPNNTATPVLVTNEANLGNLGSLRYSFDAVQDNTLTITGADSGSGAGDMQIYVPYSNFAGLNNSDNVYFWVKMTNTVNSGFQEFAYDRLNATTFATFVPEPQTVWGGISMAGLLIGGLVRRRWMQAKRNA